ncbi:MAG: tRNA 2-thiouridine(34) synthase MnmA [Flavobacteriaceae bacterium]|nr:tRNA 2-thiouridine(34) synthase MnmA [Flavobacteriaceae bacterium]
MKKVIIGLSGGVDSSVSALLLKQQGYEVIGLFMKNWHDESVTISDECPWLDDSNDAMLIAEKLGIPFQTVDLSKEYHSRIIDYMFNEYENGRTPNPDVLCNREIKFDVFLEIALGLGADYIATGHYCQVNKINKDHKEIYRLIVGADENKDQSYFLCQLNQKQLSRAIFPIGHLNKADVRNIAKKNDLITADKKDSQGLCFVGKVKLPDFLKQRLIPKKGKVIKIDSKFIQQKIDLNLLNSKEEELELLSSPFSFSSNDGQEIGEHNGAYYYTVGQRKGLNIGGFREPLFVIQTDVSKNIIYVGMGESHPALFKKALFVNSNEIHWIREDLKIYENETMEVKFRIRYRQPLHTATLFMFKKGLYMLFDKPISSVTSGQFVSWYLDDELIGSGIIS